MAVVKHKDMLISALGTLFHSWGGETPPEVFWGANELLDWYEAEFGLVLGIRFDEESILEPNYDDVITAIENS